MAAQARNQFRALVFRANEKAPVVSARQLVLKKRKKVSYNRGVDGVLLALVVVDDSAWVKRYVKPVLVGNHDSVPKVGTYIGDCGACVTVTFFLPT